MQIKHALILWVVAFAGIVFIGIGTRDTGDEYKPSFCTSHIVNDSSGFPIAIWQDKESGEIVDAEDCLQH